MVAGGCFRSTLLREMVVAIHPRSNVHRPWKW
jgi:hypothetical protein